MRLRGLLLAGAVLVAPAAWSRPRIIEVVLTTEGFAKVFGSVGEDGQLLFDGRIPRLYVYSRAGFRTAVITGYSPALLGQVTGALGARAGAGSPPLADLLAVVRTHEGAALTKKGVLGPGAVVAEFQASWCLPCRTVRADLERLDDDVTVLSIDADTRRVDMKAVYRHLVPKE